MDNKPLAHVKVIAGIEHTETDDYGLFDIANPFSAITQVVTLNFEYAGTYKYEQLHASSVKDVAVAFKFNLRQPLVPKDGSLITRGEISKMPTIDMTTAVKAGGGGLMTNGRSNSINVGGGMRSSTVTVIDGVIINGKLPNLGAQCEFKKESFFKRLFRRKAK